MKSTVETKICELVKLGHERADELKAACGAVDVRSVAQLISDLAAQLDVQFARSNALAAENAHMQQVIGEVQILYYESDGIVGYHLNGEVAKWDDVMPDLWAETPATTSFMAEVRASAIKSALDDCSEYLDRDCIMESNGISYDDAALREIGAMALQEALLRKEAAQ